MIVSYTHNYIFIKTVKVAGTSVEMALSCDCGPRDIITPIYPRDEIHRKASSRRPQNFSYDPALERQYAEAADRKDMAILWKMFRAFNKSATFYNHMPATEIRAAVGEVFWGEAFKFTIDRNPYDRIVSNAFWIIRDRNYRAQPDADQIADAIEESIEQSKPSSEFYTIDDAVAVDRVLCYESLTQDLASIVDKIGSDISNSLPRAKSGTRTADQTAANLLTAEQKQRIADRHARTFDLLGYQIEI
jgi:hypothetical protein